MGMFTEYRIYKNLYNLVNKRLIQKREKSESEENYEKKIEEEYRKTVQGRINTLFRLLLLALILLFLFTFLRPFRPFAPDSLLFPDSVYQLLLQADRDRR